MILWTDSSCIAAAPATRYVSRPCGDCGRPVQFAAERLPLMRTPIECRRCRIARRAGEILRDLSGAAVWGVIICAWLWAWLWLGGAR